MEQDDIQQAPESGWIRRLLDRVTDRLFAAEDARALDRGLQVRRTRGGLGRTYRDPRWDRVSLCDSCDPTIDDDCPRCGGVGVVHHDEVDDSTPGELPGAGTEVA